jgi:hypothetical protein
MSRDERTFAPRDRVWLGVNNIQFTSLPENLDADAVTARVAALAEAEPGLRYFTRTVPGRPGRYIDATTPEQARQAAVGLVQTLPGTDLNALADAAAALLDSDDGTPVPAVFAGQGIVGHRFPHVFGDGLSAITHLRRLAAGPEPTSSKHPWPIPGVERPLAASLKERYLPDGKAPRHLLDGAKLLLSDLRMERPASDAAPAVHPDGGPDGAGPAGAQRVTIVFKHLDGAVTGQLKAWRKANAPGVSTMSILAAAIRRGLAEQHLVPAEQGMFMAYDLRTYLPRGSATGGNFISVTYLAPGDPLSPVSVNAAVREANQSRRPLLGLAAGAARLAGRAGRIQPMRAPATTRDVAFSHMRLGALLPPDLVAAPGAPAVIFAASTPPTVGGVAFTLGEIADQTSVTAVFCSPFTPKARVQAVLDELAEDPVRLLDQNQP